MPDRNVPIDDQWNYPGRLPRAKEGDASEEDAAPVELGRMLQQDAETLCARLVAVGIPCSLTTEPVEGDEPLEPGLVAVLVRTIDLETAREVLDRPIDPEEQETKDDLFTDKEYIKSWVCPKCRRGRLVLLPYSRNWKLVRQAIYIVLAIPPVIMILLWAFPIRTTSGTIHAIPADWEETWVLSTVGLIAVLLFIGATVRAKRCPDCQWQSGGTQTTEEAEG